MDKKSVFSGLIHGPKGESAREKELLDGWKRARADYENLLKRAAEERKNARESGIDEALMELMPLLDLFETALRHKPEALAGDQWAAGIEQILKLSAEAFVRLGVEEIAPSCGKLDTAWHEAVGEKESGAEKGTIVETAAKGYRRAGRLIRPAKVILAK